MIDRQQVQKIAHLARLDITPTEEEEFAPQLNRILEYFDQLSKLDTENVPPTTRAIELSNITRSDSSTVCSDRESLLKQAPEQEGEFFRVPQILKSDEE
ncbi:Asp-tRNA(Asn)/Glu-tRNA(Gln) amidotransferase subunit GatC [cyanobacterium endosymbiont of Epithemia turgida]|uniref:Asp-tRNA(Asn)/Glu-tRNA(Gln) amidotransferase subunit GatC n=1 Tax=cyanobacterium endosymbiont of Epithemia turgida TaxID=718217 RepID=UPI0004D0FC4B|nr:Asp-tRNA(Asn)/Glu-tRNA(Gln) amidotransferase subunit GatC [cyanobacterium endosymbiont of Epithemia turgida]BAP18288.1 glutamyl-tRNA (Gln) amidotransferase subunit C [cyanobacterium endosymbiont of Epithemia turgida isolate EtSB Lake Yunoko]